MAETGTLYLASGKEYRPPPRPPSGELGSTGTSVFSGLMLQQDYNTDLQGTALYDVYDRMRRADGQVKAGLAVAKLPLMRARWTVEPGDDSPKQKEIAEFLEADLMKGMTIPWRSFFRQALLMLDFGCMVFEPVWEIKDGMVHLRKLAPRMPRTVMEWKVDDHGGLAGIKQQATSGDTIREVDIPVEKLLVFVNEQEGSNFRGVSLLRAAYKHWYIKDKLYIVDAIAKERRGIGIDVGTLQENHSPDLNESVQSALMTLHAHEKQFLVEEENQWKYRIEGAGQGRLLDPMTSIEHHDTRILRSILAEFLNMGEGSTGSLAMHKDKSSFYLMALKGVAQEIAETITTYLIRKWVGYNWNVDGVYPSIKHSRLETRDTLNLATAVKALVEVGALHPDPGIEDELRADLDFPERPEEEQEASRRTYHLSKKRRLTRLEEAVNFKAIEKALEDAQAEIVEIVRVHQRDQVASLVKDGKVIFETGNLGRLEDVKVPFKNRIAAGVKKVLQALYDLGREEAQREFTLQGLPLALAMKPLEPEKSRQVKAFLATRSRALSNLMADRLRSAYVWEMLDQVANKSWDKLRLEGQLAALSERQVKSTAGSTVSEAINLGRAGAAQENATKIEHAIYSSVLDGGTCGPCENADGREFALDSPAYEEHQPPYRECEGKGRCRCVYVYKMKEESPTG